MNKYSVFYFESYRYDADINVATFSYSYDHERRFVETIEFSSRLDKYDEVTLDRALQLAHILLGLSYYKNFPTDRVVVESFAMSSQQAKFFTEVYRDGLSQFVYENNLNPKDLAIFEASSVELDPINNYSGDGITILQSGGKDSLLLAELVKQKDSIFSTLYVSSGGTHPAVIDKLSNLTHRDIIRRIDSAALQEARKDGGLNGHVPITYIFVSLALIDMVLHNESTLLLGIGQEGEEAYLMIGDYAIRHQWSKTWRAEKLMAQYVESEIATTIKVGSPLRIYTELKIAELFVAKCWKKYSYSFSSCNIGNYMQGQANSELRWCGECAKCANSFLLFAPFVEPGELLNVFGENLLTKPSLMVIFKGLLDVDSASKPFECVGETAELRLAYHMAVNNFPEAGYELPFEVPNSDFKYEQLGSAQTWAQEMIQ